MDLLWIHEIHCLVHHNCVKNLTQSIAILCFGLRFMCCSLGIEDQELKKPKSFCGHFIFSTCCLMYIWLAVDDLLLNIPWITNDNQYVELTIVMWTFIELCECCVFKTFSSIVYLQRVMSREKLFYEVWTKWCMNIHIHTFAYVYVSTGWR